MSTHRPTEQTFRTTVLFAALGLTLGWATCHESPPGECGRPAHHPDGTHSAPWEGKDITDPLAVSRAEIVTFAKCVGFESTKGKSLTPLRPYHELYPYGSIAPAKGTTYLTIRDIMDGADKRTGWIVGRIYTNKPYFHGLKSDTNYVYLDFPNGDSARVIIIPHDATSPISVLTQSSWSWMDPNTDTSQSFLPGQWKSTRVPADSLVGPALPELTRTAYLATLSDWASACSEQGRYACWSHDPSPRRGEHGIVRTTEGGGNSSDGWIQVTGTGCVCVGTKCH